MYKKAITKLQAILLIVVVIVCAVIAGYYLWVTQIAIKGEIVLGASLPLSGIMAREGTMVKNGYDMWLEEVNAKGGILGMKVRIIIYDDASDKSSCISDYERLVTVDNVDLLLGPASSDLSAVSAPVAEKYKIPMVHPDDGADVILQNKYNYTFTIFPPVSWHGRNFVDMLLHLNPKPQTIAIIKLSHVYSLSVCEGFKKAAQEAGLSLVLEEEYPEDITTFAPIIQKIKSVNPDVLFVGAKVPLSILLAREMKEYDVNPKIWWASFGPADPEYIKELGPDANYVTSVMLWSPNLKAPGVKEFADKYKNRYNEIATYYPAASYIACKILEDAILRAGSLDKEKVRVELEKTDTTLLGWHIKFSRDPLYWGGNIGNPGFVMQIQNQTYKIVWPPDYAEANCIYPIPAWSERA